MICVDIGSYVYLFFGLMFAWLVVFIFVFLEVVKRHMAGKKK